MPHFNEAAKGFNAAAGELETSFFAALRPPLAADAQGLLPQAVPLREQQQDLVLQILIFNDLQLRQGAIFCGVNIKGLMKEHMFSQFVFAQRRRQ